MAARSLLRATGWLIGLTLIFGAPRLASAQPPAAPARQTASPPPAQPTANQLTGAKLKDARGVTVGQIEKVISNLDGRPRQVLVRVTRVRRTLPVDALTRVGDAYVTALTRAELEALPPSN
jgi:hypothetical protein